MDISVTSTRYAHKASVVLCLLNLNEINQDQIRSFPIPNIKNITASVRALFYRRSNKIKDDTFSKLYLMFVLYMKNRTAFYFAGLASGLLLAVFIRIIF